MQGQPEVMLVRLSTPMARSMELAERARAEARERLDAERQEERRAAERLAQAKRKHSEHMRAVLELEGVGGGAAAASAPAPAAPTGLAVTAPAEPSGKYRIKKRAKHAA